MKYNYKRKTSKVFMKNKIAINKGKVIKKLNNLLLFFGGFLGIFIFFFANCCWLHLGLWNKKKQNAETSSRSLK